MLISLAFLFCKEETPLEPKEETFTFSGKVYSIIDSQKVYMDSVKVFFREDSTLTNNEGSFSFENVPTGEYQVSFAFTTVSDSIKISNQNVIIGKEDFFEEYFLFQYETIVEVYSLSGKVYALENEERIYLENVNVSILDTTVVTDNLGFFI